MSSWRLRVDQCTNSFRAGERFMPSLSGPSARPAKPARGLLADGRPAATARAGGGPDRARRADHELERRRRVDQVEQRGRRLRRGRGGAERGDAVERGPVGRVAHVRARDVQRDHAGLGVIRRLRGAQDVGLRDRSCTWCARRGWRAGCPAVSPSKNVGLPDRRRRRCCPSRRSRCAPLPVVPGPDHGPADEPARVRAAHRGRTPSGSRGSSRGSSRSSVLFGPLASDAPVRSRLSRAAVRVPLAE